MKLYIVYFRTMQDSPKVEIHLVTFDHGLAKAKLKELEKEEQEWMKDEDKDSGNWAEAKMCELDTDKDIELGDTFFIVTFTLWYECVETTLTFHGDLDAAMECIAERKNKLKSDFPGITSFDDDFSFEDSVHLRDDSVMVDAYFDVAAFKRN